MPFLPRMVYLLGSLALSAMLASGCSGGTSRPASVLGPAAALPQSRLAAARVAITIGALGSAAGQRSARHVAQATNGVRVRVYDAGTTTNLRVQSGFDVSSASPLCATSGNARTCTLSLGLAPGAVDVTVETYDALVAPNGTVPSGANLLDQGTLLAQTVVQGTPITMTVSLSPIVGVVSTLAGQASSGFANGVGTAAQFNTPADLAVDSNGIVYVVEDQNHALRKVLPDGTVSILAGTGASGLINGPGASAQFASPNGVAVDGPGNNVYIADTFNNAIRQVTAAGMVSTLAGGGGFGFTDATGALAQFYSPNGVAVDGAGNVYVTDTSNNAIRKVTSGGVVTTYAGQASSGSLDATGTAAQFNGPFGIAIDRSTNIVYVADSGNNSIRKIAPGGIVTTIAGGTLGYLDGIGTTARFYNPTAIAVDPSGNLYVADANNNRIRKITPSGVVSTFAGAASSGFVNGIGSSAQFLNPLGVAVDLTGTVYVADANNNAIRIMK